MPSTSNTWPHDVLIAEAELPRHGENNLICFLGCAFHPQDRADEIMNFIERVCDEIGKNFGARISCIRGDQLAKPGTIHTDLWQYIRLADALIFDVTGFNGNVLIELGVAAAVRSQTSVIIIRDKEDQAQEGTYLFDIAPTRHLPYQRSLLGSIEFQDKLKVALLDAFTPAPYIPSNYTKTQLPLTIKLDEKRDSIHLLGPPSSHRCAKPDGLEFGSLYVFQNSWLTVGNENYSNIRVKAKLKISTRRPGTGLTEGWVGISLCSTHFFANYSHLVYVKPDGSLCYYEPQNEFISQEIKWGQLPNFNPTVPIEISVSLDSEALTMK